MTQDKTTAPQHPITTDMPLPGFYPCLTLQLNLTRYQAAESFRWVAIVREPSEQVECIRRFADTADWGVDTVDMMCNQLRQVLTEMVWLQAGKAS